jgi:hypothetical protein
MTAVKTRKRRSFNIEKVMELKTKINDDSYLYGAIFRLAQVLSNEMLGIANGGHSAAGGMVNERQYIRRQ